MQSDTFVAPAMPNKKKEPAATCHYSEVVGMAVYPAATARLVMDKRIRFV
jgi:hypothetical protein